jgi:hypothetical protein
MRDAVVMVGNSSSGIIEAASFGTPVIDVGPRQLGRERSQNVTNVPYSEDAPPPGPAAHLELRRGRNGFPSATSTAGPGGRAHRARIIDRAARCPPAPQTSSPY